MDEQVGLPPESSGGQPEEELVWWLAPIVVLVLAGLVMLILALLKPKVENIFMRNTVCYAIAPPPPSTSTPSPEARDELLARLVAEGRLPDEVVRMESE